MLIDVLLELQEVDTALDRLAHRRGVLPERTALDEATAALRSWEADIARLRGRVDELGAEIERAEAESAEIDRSRDRLRAQLRTVIAPREAEALQREMATLEQQRSELDDRGLAALEEQATVDDELTARRGHEAELRSAVERAEAAFDAVITELDAEAAGLDGRRGPLRDRIDAAMLARYDRLRAHLGVAVARLVGHRCDGCHLDLSPAEVDQIKAVAPNEPASCPQCDRILVR